jgi:hypothetical protein
MRNSDLRILRLRHRFTSPAQELKIAQDLAYLDRRERAERHGTVQRHVAQGLVFGLAREKAQAGLGRERYRRSAGQRLSDIVFGEVPAPMFECVEARTFDPRAGEARESASVRLGCVELESLACELREGLDDLIVAKDV